MSNPYQPPGASPVERVDWALSPPFLYLAVFGGSLSLGLTIAVVAGAAWIALAGLIYLVISLPSVDAPL